MNVPTPGSSSSQTPYSHIEFTDVTVKAGLGDFYHETGAVGNKWMPESMGSGGGFIDYNGDGWIDILLVGGGVWPQSDKEVRVLWLYKNNGDGTFTLVTEEAGLADVSTYGLGITVADYDNDGDQDFFLSTLYENMLFRNDGGVFTEVGEQAGIAKYSDWSSSAIFFDANRDGWLDLYVGNYVDWSPEKDIYCTLAGENAYCTPEEYEGVPGRFYINNGDGTFTDRTEEAGFVSEPGKNLGVAAIDFNRDGWPGLIVANDLERNLLYKNNGDGTFTEIGLRAGIAYDEHGNARAGMGIDVGVVDSTGQPTLFVGNFSDEMIGVFRHIGNGLFVDRAAVSKIGRPSLPILTFGLFLFDVEYDGDLDLFAANGHMQPAIERAQDGISYRQPSQLYINLGDGTFKNISPLVGGVLQDSLVARGAAYADYDKDGDLDILLTENGGPAHLWRNDSETGHYLRVQLVGRQSNRDGIGARLVAVADDQRMIRYIRTGSSYLSQSEKVATFGLEATRVDSLIVHWPSGQVGRFADIAADQMIRITEGTGAFEPVDMPANGTLAQR